MEVRKLAYEKEKKRKKEKKDTLNTPPILSQNKQKEKTQTNKKACHRPSLDH